MFYMQKSDVHEISEVDAKKEINLYLKSCEKEKTLISGRVLCNSTKRAIERACIKITDENYNPIKHCYTDMCGRFKLYILKNKKIIIHSVKQGYLTFTSRVYSSDDHKLKNFLIELEKIKGNQNILTGRILSMDKYPIKHLEIGLISLKHPRLFYETSTNADGIFLFYDILPSIYKIISLSSEFLILDNKVCIKQENWFTDAKVIYARYKIKGGTINGMIKDTEGKPIKTAVVILYNADKNIPLKMTYTNDKGIYLFEDLPAGRYYIVAQK